MVDSKLTALTAETAPVGADLVYLVDDVAGTPTSKKATLTDVAASAPFSGTYAPLTLQAVIASAEATPALHTPNNTSFEQWGTEEAVIAQADAPTSAVVLAWLSGGISGAGAAAVGDRGAAKLQVSFDGGSNFADLGNTATATLYAASGSDDEHLSSVGRATGTVTGDIQVRAMCRDVTTANHIVFSGGRITVLVHPQ